MKPHRGSNTRPTSTTWEPRSRDLAIQLLHRREGGSCFRRIALGRDGNYLSCFSGAGTERARGRQGTPPPSVGRLPRGTRSRVECLLAPCPKNLPTESNCCKERWTC